MPLEGGTAIVRVIADASKLNATIAAQTRGATSGLSGLGSRISSALSNPIVVAGAVVTGVVAKMGFDFEDAFTRIDAISNASSKDIAQWREQVMTLGRETAQSPKDLADALYFLASAGLKAGEVFPALEASAKASAVGLGDVAQVGSVVAAVLNAYADTGIRATDVTDTLVAAVRESRAETDEFGQTLGRLLPISARAGISFGELAGSLASLSNIGLDVYEAATAMRAATQAIVAPGEKAANTMESLGLSAQDLLDAIHKRGLLGALQLLDKTIKGNTDSESEYLRTFRDIIPNIRALTGVLGLTGNNAKHVQSIFEATTHATGDLGQALSVVQKGPAFQFRQVINDLKITGTDLGTHVLPIITDALKLLAPLIKLVADNAGKLLAAFIAWKALGFVPVLLGLIADGLIAIGGGTVAAGGIYAAAKATGHLGTSAVAAEGWLAKLGIGLKTVGGTGLKAAAGTALTAYSLGEISASAQTSKTDLEALNNIATSYYNINKSGNATIDTSISMIQAQAQMYHGNAEALAYAAEKGVSYSDALWLTVDAGDEANHHAKAIAKSLRQAAQGMDDTAHKAHQVTHAFERWGFATDKAFADFKQGVRESAQVGVGEFETLADAFKTTPTELSHQLDLAIQIARTKQHDLAAIFGDKTLSKAQQKALASLPADQRHAWAIAGEAGRTELTHQATTWQRLNSRTFTQMAGIVSPKAKGSGHKTGHDYGAGVASGINSSAPLAVAAAIGLAHRVNEATRTALDEGSPSKEAAKTGRWFVEGIILGLKQREAALTNAASHVADVLKKQLDNARNALHDAVDKGVGEAAAEAAVAIARGRVKQAHELEKMVAQAEKALNRIVDKFKEFKSTIKDGFSDFGDLGSIISDQWAQYQADMKSYQEAVAAFVPEFDDQGRATNTAPVMPNMPDFAATIQEQVSNAQRLALDLQNAAAAGLSKSLLGQFAGQGAAGADALEQLMANPALIQQLNEASKTINQAANGTASALGNQFFGKAVAEATAEFKDATKALRSFIQAMMNALSALGAKNQLQHLNQVLNQGMQSGGGGGGDGNDRPPPGFFNGNGSGLNWTQPWHPPVTVNVNGWVGNDQQIAARVRDELLRVGRNNGGTGL